MQEKFEISWKNAEVINNESGKPKINFIGLSFPQIKSMDISISHCKQYATANVVIMYEETVGNMSIEKNNNF